MSEMTDARAVEVLAAMREDGGVVADADYTAAIDHVIARLGEPAEVGGDAVFNCPTCPVSVQGQWQGPECPECGERCYIDATAAPQPPAEAQARGGGWCVERSGDPDFPQWAEVKELIVPAPPSAPVGLVEAVRALKAKYQQHIDADHFPYHFWRDLESALAQQPAAVDGACCHSWHDYGQVNRSWCRKCNALAVTGYEDRPYALAAQQPAAVDGAQLRYEDFYLREAAKLLHRRGLSDLASALTAALAQPGGSDNDR